MILGIGSDLCNIDRIAAVLERHGERFRNRVFTEREQAKAQSHGLGIFIRSLVGLDSETARQAFSQFITGTTATASQIEFIDLVVQYLTENGVMEPARLYESPFIDINDKGPEAIFLPARVDEMVRVLEGIRARAVG